METSLRYSIACVDQQPNSQCDANNAHAVAERHSVKEAFSKGNGILMIF